MNAAASQSRDRLRRAVVIGDLEVARRTRHALEEFRYEVQHLAEPSDEELRLALTERVDAVAVLVRGDVVALRYALLVEHLRPKVQMVVTIFDQTIAGQLMNTVQNCQVTSPADMAVPSIVAACLGDQYLAIHHHGKQATVVEKTPHGKLTRKWHPEKSRSLAARIVTAQIRPYDLTSRMLIIGALGILLSLTVEWLLGIVVLHASVARSFYFATRVIATVGPADATGTPEWYLILSGSCMLLTIGFTALLTAAIVNRSLSSRSVAIFGPRTVPRRNHVVVVGLGQVGLRLCLSLRALDIPVIAVERDPNATNLRLARTHRIPVLIGRAEDRAVLQALSLHRARALAAMGADDLDNVEVAIAALALTPELRIVLRAGDNDVITETRSLFRIGSVCDVSALTAHAVTTALTAGATPPFVYLCDDLLVAHDHPGDATEQRSR